MTKADRIRELQDRYNREVRAIKNLRRKVACISKSIGALEQYAISLDEQLKELLKEEGK